MARLRAECVRTGVREVTVTKGPGFGGPRYVARITPVELPTSKVIRLRRLYQDTVYKEDLHHLQLPVSAAADVGHHRDRRPARAAPRRGGGLSRVAGPVAVARGRIGLTGPARARSLG